MEQTARYPKHYGLVTGLRTGTAPDFTRCCVEVSGHQMWANYHQCTRKRGHGPDGAYCKQHDPAAAEARRKASDAKYAQLHNNLRIEWAGPKFFEALVKIADGHNDPRAVAQEAIKDYR